MLKHWSNAPISIGSYTRKTLGMLQLAHLMGQCSAYSDTFTQMVTDALTQWSFQRDPFQLTLLHSTNVKPLCKCRREVTYPQ